MIIKSEVEMSVVSEGTVREAVKKGVKVIETAKNKAGGKDVKKKKSYPKLLKMSPYDVEDLIQIMEMSMDEVFKMFIVSADGFNCDYYFHEEFPKFLFIHGKAAAENRAMLVAHADTVWEDGLIEVERKNGILFSKQLMLLEIESSYEREEINGIGADDRAGCEIVYKLFNRYKGNHSVLITSAEEIGLGPAIIRYDDIIMKEVPKHQWALEFDRLGYNEVVFYNSELKKFKEFIINTTGYSETKSNGSSDVAEICRYRIPSVNMAVGYRYPHKINEYLDIRYWWRSYNRGIWLLNELEEKNGKG